ncbi:MAG: hypothetical protein V4719_26075, partial [Planctomycetota bacterium]
MMLARLRMGSLLVVALALGCTKTEPAVQTPSPVATTDQEDPPVQPGDESLELAQAAFEGDAPPKLTPSEMPAETSDDFEDELSPKKEAELLAQLKKEPNNAEVLLKLANFTQEKAELTDSGEVDYGMLKQSADYLRRAFKADEALAKSDEMKAFAAAVHLNEARALSLDKQDDNALKALRSAIDYGWSDLAEIQAETDLEHIRKNPKFAEIMQFAKDKRKSDMQAMVAALFLGKPDFKFDFKLEDTDGKPIAKKDFLGKV